MDPANSELCLFDYSVVTRRAGGMTWPELRNAQYTPRELLRSNGEVVDTDDPDYQRWRHGVR